MNPCMLNYNSAYFENYIHTVVQKAIPYVTAVANVSGEKLLDLKVLNIFVHGRRRINAELFRTDDLLCKMLLVCIVFVQCKRT